jgi:hypothetical protein
MPDAGWTRTQRGRDPGLGAASDGDVPTADIGTGRDIGGGWRRRWDIFRWWRDVYRWRRDIRRARVGAPSDVNVSAACVRANVGSAHGRRCDGRNGDGRRSKRHHRPRSHGPRSNPTTHQLPSSSYGFGATDLSGRNPRMRLCFTRSESRWAATLLPCHRDREPVLGVDEVVVGVIADVDLHPVDLTVELVAGGAVVG